MENTIAMCASIPGTRVPEGVRPPYAHVWKQRPSGMTRSAFTADLDSTGMSAVRCRH